MSALATVLLVSQLVNPSFDADPAGPKGWTREIGATTGKGPMTADISIVPRGGAHAVRFKGRSNTQRWPMLTQTVPVKPGQRVLFRVVAKAVQLHRRPNQYDNANALLIFQTADGRRISLLTSPVISGDTDWVPLAVTAIAPPESARVVVGIFASKSGVALFDDARLTIASTDRADPEARRVAFDVLRLHLARTYPFFGMEGKPRNASELKPDPNNSDFTAELNGALGALKDIHVWYDDGGRKVYPGPLNRAPPNYNVYAVRARLDPVFLEKRNRLIGQIGDIGYIGLGSFVGVEFEGVLDAIGKLKYARALIIDVRFNNGGNEMLARQVAARFVRKPTVYGSQQRRDPLDPAKLVAFRNNRSFRPNPKLDPRPVIVLQGPHCVSSGEAFLMMMRAIGGNIRTVGLPSRGASGNPKPFRLLPDLVVYSSTWRSLLPDGTCFEGVGVPPMKRFEAPKKAYLKGDPTLDHALALLAK